MGDLVIVQDEAQQAQFYVDGQPAVSLAGDPADRLQQLTSDYRAALGHTLASSQAEQRFREIGGQLFAWLQDRGNWGQRLIAKAPGRLEFRLQPGFCERDQIGGIVAAAPWELLADDRGFLARRLNSRFLAVRRFLNGQGTYQPSQYRLSLVFMAASPHGQPELDYRAEEVAIATSAGRTGVDLTVEETGQLEQLADTLTILRQDMAETDVFHLSCHGLNRPQPAVALEGETGELALVDAAELWRETKQAHYLAIDAKLQALDETETRVLQMSTLLELPAPRDVLASLAGQLWQVDGEAVCRRLSSFGLWDRLPDPVQPSRDACAVNQLAAPRIASPAGEEVRFYAEHLLPALSAAWPHADCPDVCDVQLCQLARLTDDVETFQQRGETALGYLDRNNLYGLGYPLATVARERMANPTPNACRLMANLICASAQSAEELQQCRDLYTHALTNLGEPSDAESAVESGALMRDRASLSRTIGDLNAAFADYEVARDCFERFDLTRERAVTLGDIARIKVSRGEVDAALELHEEELRVYESLGDQRSRAVTLGDIARIKVSRGEVDAALELHEERLRVFESLGDQRSRAVTLGDIARIKVDRGEVDAALELHEERLRVFESLGDQRSRAVTLGDIARIKVSRGEVDAALELHEEKLKVMESLGDQRSRAVTLGDIARIKVSRGEVDAALELQDERLRVNRQLGDRDGIAAAQNDRFDILWQKEQHQDAVEAISEAFSVWMQTGRMEGIGVVGLKLGQVLAAIGHSDARHVLGVARQAWEKLGNQPYLDQVDQLLDAIPAQDDPSAGEEE